jgi:ADP-ribose pyrophosphatase YjhB (NUDIX family)
VRHAAELEYFALPGGHLEWGEKVKDCFKREIIEELGIEPEIGRLLYVNNLTIESGEGKQSVEFFFEVINSADYLDITKLNGTHKNELFEVLWIGKNEDKEIRPLQLQIDLNNDSILSDTVRFL